MTLPYDGVGHFWFVRITTHSGILRCGRVNDPPLRRSPAFIEPSKIRKNFQVRRRGGYQPPALPDTTPGNPTGESAPKYPLPGRGCPARTQ